MRRGFERAEGFTPLYSNRIPHSLEAERSVLGSVIGPAGQSSAADKALEALTAEDFHSAAHRDIFSAMKKLYDSGKSIDLTTLTDVLERDGKLEAVGGNSDLVDLAIAPPSVSNIEHYVEIVTAHSVRRKLMATGNMIAREAVESSKDPKQILDDAERQIYNIAMRKTAEHIPSIGEVYADVYKQIGELMQLKGRRTGIPTGLADLDELTSGLQRGDLIIVAGRPSAGKSAFAFGIAAHAAIRENANVLIFSLEMPREQIVMRIMSSEAGINMHKLRTGELEADEIFRIADQFNTVGEANMLIDDSPLATVAEIRSKCRRVQAQQDIRPGLREPLGRQGAERGDNPAFPALARAREAQGSYAAYERPSRIRLHRAGCGRYNDALPPRDLSRNAGGDGRGQHLVYQRCKAPKRRNREYQGDVGAGDSKIHQLRGRSRISFAFGFSDRRSAFEYCLHKKTPTRAS